MSKGRLKTKEIMENAHYYQISYKASIEKGVPCGCLRDVCFLICDDYPKTNIEMDAIILKFLALAR